MTPHEKIERLPMPGRIYVKKDTGISVVVLGVAMNHTGVQMVSVRAKGQHGMEQQEMTMALLLKDFVHMEVK